MRRAYHGIQFIPYEDKVIGVCLGYDHCSEHEWGIKRLEKLLGTKKTEKKLWGLGRSKPILGIDSRRIHTLDPHHLLYRETLDGDGLLVYWPRHLGVVNGDEADESRVDAQIDNLLNRILAFSHWDKKNDIDIISAWSDGSFAIRVVGNDNIEYLRSIYDALRNNNAIVTLAHTAYPDVFPDGGLYIFIGDEFPEHVDEAMKQDDQSRMELRKAHQKLGLEQELKNKGKRWFALSPRWVKDFRSPVESEYDMIYWLNPMEQRIYKAGWFTVEELRQWGDNEGPVIKKES